MMKKKRRIRSRIKHIRVSFENHQTTIMNVLTIFLKWLSLVLIPSSFLLILADLSEIVNRYIGVSLISLGIMAIIYIIGSKLTKKSGIYLPLIFLITPLVALVLIQNIRNTYFLMVNEVLKQVGQIRGTYLFGLSVDYSTTGTLFFMILLGVFLMGLSIGIFSYEKIGLFIVWVAIFLLIMILKGQLNLLSMLCLIFGTLMISFIKSLNRRHTIQTTGSIYMSLCLILSTFLILGVSWAMQVDGFNQSIKSVEKIQSEIKDKGKQVRYAKGKKTPLTRGKVSEVTSFDPEKIILEVEMSQPEPIYLKNYVGSEYTSGAWSEQGMEELYENYGMIYWLGDNQFTSFSQLSDLSRLTTQEESIHVSVKNIGESSETLFVPYGMTYSKGLNDMVTNDNMLLSKGLTGDRQMSFDMISLAITTYPELVGTFANLKSDNQVPKVTDYLVNEANYNDYVYKNYLSVPKTIGTELSMLTNQGKETQQRVFYEEADEVVRQALNKEESTAKEFASTPKDFISQFIDHKYDLKTPEEFATIATLMYRQLGVPARYVEGYLVTPKEVTEAKNNKMSIPAKNAHAWVEIYQDGVGWVPKEVMSRTQNMMPQPVFNTLPHSGSHSSQDGKSAKDLPVESEKISDGESNQQEIKHQKEKQRKPYVIISLLIFLIFLMLAIFIFIFMKLKHIIHLKKEQQSLFNQSDHFLAAQSLYRDMANMMILDGVELTFYDLEKDVKSITTYYGEDYGQFYQGVVWNLEMSLYTETPLSAKKLEMTRHCHELTSHYVFNKQKWRQKRQMKKTLLTMFYQE